MNIQPLIEYIQSNSLDVIASMLGLLFLYLEYTAKKSMWVVSILMSILYVYIFYKSELYALSITYIYFFVTSCYGFFKWSQKSAYTEESTITTRMPSRKWMTVGIGFLVAFAIIYLLLNQFTNAHNFLSIGDAVATSLNVIAPLMAAKRWAEQWCLYIPANLLTAILMYAQNEYASSLMFTVYFIVSIMGYYNWIKLSKKTKSL